MIQNPRAAFGVYFVNTYLSQWCSPGTRGALRHSALNMGEGGGRQNDKLGKCHFSIFVGTAVSGTHIVIVMALR